MTANVDAGPFALPTTRPATGRIDALGWVLVRDRRLLSVRTKGKEKFYLPGGKREPGESDVVALCREVREELGVELDPLTFSFFAVLDVQADGFAAGHLVHQVSYTADFAGELAPGAEIAELDWLTSVDADRCPPAGRRILEVLREADTVD
ncbi:NUDIX hydrolase [Fodinicola feengrottensis]|uniref:NUDIX domain-containing protein n=1 Tax=Fodinicola feengrottensis TaxID=435914 RepID=A0ABN2GBC9_9ACTN|nr:NUDIX domain-containing protein [Fodinicola feengrottensis]